VYDELNKRWKATCRILFGEEIGELEEYKEYLTGLGYSELARKKSLKWDIYGIGCHK